MQTTIPNTRRKFTATPRRGPSALPKGNHYSTNTARGGARDTKPAFPQIVFGNEKPYEVDPYEIVNGIYFDVLPRRLGVIPGAQKTAAPAKPTATKRTRRTDPGPGRRPSLSAIRAKG